MVGVIGVVTSVVAFINLAAGNKGIVTITMLCIGIGTIEIGLLYVLLKKKRIEDSPIVLPEHSFGHRPQWAYSKKARLLALGMAVFIPILIAVTIGLWSGIRNQPSPTSSKFVVLVMNFDGPEQDKYRTTDILIEGLREATEKYPEVEIRALSKTITAQQGSAEARRLGEENKASIVLWGWYGKTNTDVLLKIHFEILASPKHLELKRNNQTVKEPLAEMERFEIQINLSNEMSYLTLLIIGLARYEGDDYAAAIERFTDALNLPTNPEVISPAAIYLYRGNAFFFSEQLDKAIADYNQVAILQDDNAEAYQNRGVAYGMKGDYDSAIRDFNRVLTLYPDYARGYYTRGFAYDNKGDYKAAVADYSKAIEFGNDYAEAYNNRGVIYDDLGKHDLAIADHSKVISIQPNNPDAYYNRGLAYGKKGELDLAIADFNQAITLKHDFTEAYYDRAFAYYNKENYDAAIADYSKAIYLNPNFADAYHDRALAYEKKGEHELAAADFKKAEELNPDKAQDKNNQRR